jgi:hypothetical protein
MWPYNEDEAGWLKPRERAAPPRRVSARGLLETEVAANDNDAGRRGPTRDLTKPAPTLPPKS